MPLPQDPTRLSAIFAPLKLDTARLMSLTQDPTGPMVIPTPLIEDHTGHTVILAPLIQDPMTPLVMPTPPTQDPTRLIMFLTPLTQDNTLDTVVLMSLRPDPTSNASRSLRPHRLQIAHIHILHHHISGYILVPHSRQNMATTGSLAVIFLSLLLPIGPLNPHRPKHLKSNDTNHRRVSGEMVIP